MRYESEDGARPVRVDEAQLLRDGVDGELGFGVQRLVCEARGGGFAVQETAVEELEEPEEGVVCGVVAGWGWG